VKQRYVTKRRKGEALAGRVIQGFFGAGGPRLAGVMQIAVQLRAAPGTFSPPPTRFAPRMPSVQPKIADPRPRASLPGAPASQVALQCFATKEVTPIDPGRLGLASGGGQPLPDRLRNHMETALGADFSAVRVHIGPQPERIGAIAFTTGTDIYFSPGRYQPSTAAGQRLLGHELAHVVQQRRGRVPALIGGIAVVQDPALEAEADRLGARAAGFRSPTQIHGGAPTADTKRHSTTAQMARVSSMRAGNLPPIGRPQQASFATFSRAIQRSAWKTTSDSVLVEPKEKPTGGLFYFWTWTEDMEITVGNNTIPLHPIHQNNVVPSKGTTGNKLWGSCTILWKSRNSSTIAHAHGPSSRAFEAKLSGEGKDGHTERQFGEILHSQIKHTLSGHGGKSDGEWRFCGIIIEIHQTNTPCSGKAGCAVYLDDLISELAKEYKVSTVVVRASADYLYESSLVGTYPGHLPTNRQSLEIVPNANLDFEGVQGFVHNKPWK
jgi:hypothetical protein